ncbi:GNAT family acetyltransferase [Paenibacillus sp. J31TS4]|uniref:GNAT family N-acetyltransferase n=1 Tax=Paenibacillus sp. J31TS4 TaxID=2807195 RepID=UPI001B2EA57E|nr:GNAT family N-acetyltransferase [Paenibacillus sp. J31TS4]GIP37688.1 GNAT family acetyltransferase [Paenibacillus sp. J31TS4]
MTQNLQTRSYVPGDERQLVDLWNRCLVQDPLTPVRFRNLVLLDANFDPEGLRIALDGERIVGCVYAVRRLLPMAGTDLEPDNGWIPFFFVDSSYRRRGIGTRLMDEAVAFLAAQNRKKIFFASYAPNYIVPGLDEGAYPEGMPFLERAGFTRLYSPVAMDYSLVGYRMPEDVQELKKLREQEGYRFRQAEDGDLPGLIRFANETFNPDWGRAIREGVLQGIPLSRIFLAFDGGTLVGFCLHGGYEMVPERFGPFGVDPGQQGKGLGKILLHDCLHAMRAQGLHGAWFLWTGETTPAGYLYKKTGFAVTRTFRVMAKTLKGD